MTVLNLDSISKISRIYINYNFDNANIAIISLGFIEKDDQFD